MGLGPMLYHVRDPMKFKHIAEVGCDGKISLHEFITPESRVQIFECNPDHLREIKRHYGDMPNVTVHPYAMWKEKGKVRFNLEGATSYVEGVQSPLLANDMFRTPEQQIIEVEARTFDEFDDGTIDIMDIDIEGAEWYVIEKMKSRPSVITIEMSWKAYVNPHTKEIEKWFSDNMYFKFKEEKAVHFYRRLV
jgi:FkbM family methyltransferase